MTGFVGTNSNDHLTGSSFLDIMLGFGGNDTLYGRGNADALYGYEGNDRLYGDDGNDKLYGGTGNDFLEGGTGGDMLLGDDGNDSLYGGANSDYFEGGSGNDFLDGGSDRDRLLGGTGNDWLCGGLADDWLEGQDGNDTLIGVGSDHGVNTIDHLAGGGSSDLFVLGTSSITYYNDGNNATSGTQDYALIKDFNSSLDKIQLSKNARPYILVSVSGILGTGIYLNTNSNNTIDHTDELIAVVQGSTGLNLSNSSFVYI